MFDTCSINVMYTFFNNKIIFTVYQTLNMGVFNLSEVNEGDSSGKVTKYLL